MRTRTSLLAVAVLILNVAAARAEEPAAPDRDKALNTALRDLINRGADLYNNGDSAACYYLFQGSLLTLRPVLDHRPDLQKAIDRGLADAARPADMRRRAWALREVLDNMRDRLRGGPAKVAEKPKEKLPKPAATLWTRLGGEEKVKAVVDDWVAIVAADEKANFTRDGKYKFDDEQIAALKKSAIAFISAATGGPIKYTGKSMKEVHKGMGITDAEFDAVAADLDKALEKNNVAKEDRTALLKVVGTTRGDIVEPKKPDEKKDKDKEDKEKDEKKKKDE